MTYSKYGNKKITVDGIEFDSVLEARYYNYLKGEVASGRVARFDMQVPYTLVRGYINPVGNKVEPVTYILDFLVHYTNGTTAHIDIKVLETITEVFKIKRKLFELQFWVELKCVTYSALDGGWVEIDDVREGRKERRKNVRERKKNGK